MAPDAPAEGRSPRERAGWWGCAFALLALVVLSATLRVRVAQADANFALGPEAGLLKSDPALTYYVAERVVESGGWPPDDLRADPRVEHPDLVDLPALLPVALPFLAAWTHLASGGALSLLDASLWVSAACASLVLPGVFLLALALTRRRGLALLAAALAAVVFANHRTLGFVFADEDLALPLFVLHLAALARAVRRPTLAWIAGAALLLAAALAAWHATVLLATLEALAVLAVCVARGVNPFEDRRALAFVLILDAASLAVPMLRAAAVGLSVPFLVQHGMLLASFLRGTRGPRSRRLALVSCVAGLALLLWAAGRALDAPSSLGHVAELLVAKVAHLGALPQDPNALSFEARTMWQGPFVTCTWSEGTQQLGFALLALPAALWALWRRRGGERLDGVELALLLFVAGGLVAAWLAVRLLVIPGFALPVLLAWSLVHGRRGAVVLALVAGAQALVFTDQMQNLVVWWYWPHERQVEIARLVRAVERDVPAGEAVAADFMTSTAILARTGRPIAFQPKWESARSRERVRDLLVGFYTQSPDAFRRMLVERYRCRYLVVDRYTLWNLSRYVAGLPDTAREPPAGTAARALLSPDEAVIRGVPGYRLLYRGQLDLRQPNGQPTDFYRLYELAP